jgi:hypothetical protein
MKSIVFLNALYAAASNHDNDIRTYVPRTSVSAEAILVLDFIFSIAASRHPV